MMMGRVLAGGMLVAIGIWGWGWDADGALGEEPVPVRRGSLVPLRLRMEEEGEKMLRELTITKYSHTTHIDREQGICEVDCSGFVVAILREVSPAHLKGISTMHKRPLAEDFYHAFVPTEGNAVPAGWERVKRVEEGKPGDLIAWLKTDRQAGDNTGHVMLIAEKPVRDGEHQFRVRIMDSTMSPHGDDSRPEGATGIGKGTIWLVVNGSGEPTGYRWKSRGGTVHEVPICLGRGVVSQGRFQQVK